MDRRKFLKDSAAAAIAGSVMGIGSLEAAAGKPGSPETFGVRVAYDLKYPKDGKLKILQLTDTHYIAGDARSERALHNVIEMLDAEKPDFVIHTGDIVFGKPAETSARAILQPLVDRNIPFAVAMGNHDSDFDLTRTEMYKILRSIPGNVNTPDDLGINGCSNDILTLSRIQAGVETMDLQPVDLQKCAESILATYRVLEEQEGFSIRLQTLPQPLLVNADQHRMEQVLSNLISNAVRYSGDVKDVTVAFLQDKKWLRCEVRDKGIGIAAEDIPNIWNRYERASARGARSKQGTGLGLSITKEILERHGAKYGVESKVGEGSTFWFALPLID